MLISLLRTTTVIITVVIIIIINSWSATNNNNNDNIGSVSYNGKPLETIMQYILKMYIYNLEEREIYVYRLYMYIDCSEIYSYVYTSSLYNSYICNTKVKSPLHPHPHGLAPAAPARSSARH